MRGAPTGGCIPTGGGIDAQGCEPLNELIDIRVRHLGLTPDCIQRAVRSLNTQLADLVKHCALRLGRSNLTSSLILLEIANIFPLNILNEYPGCQSLS